MHGMQGVRGSNPLSSTPGQRADSARPSPDRPPQAADRQQPPLRRPIRRPPRRHTGGAGWRRLCDHPMLGSGQVRFEASASGPGGAATFRYHSDPAPTSAQARVGSGPVGWPAPSVLPVLPGQDRIGRQGMAERARLG